MLRGIWIKSAHLLCDMQANPVTFDILRKMREPRQIESCEPVVVVSNYASSYARALLAATPDEGRLQPSKRAIPAVTTTADLVLMERELKAVQQNAVGGGILRTGNARSGDHRPLRFGMLARRSIARYFDHNHSGPAKEFIFILWRPWLSLQRGNNPGAGLQPGRCKRDVEAVSFHTHSRRRSGNADTIQWARQWLAIMKWCRI